MSSLDNPGGPQPAKSEITTNFETRRKILIRYLMTKVEEGDWHAVSDAANDLRVMEAVYNARGRHE